MTSATSERTPFFRHDRWCKLFIEVLYNYRKENFKLHEFVLMPDHFHLLITPRESLERAIQLIKGGFSRQAAVQFETKQQIWQRGFTDHRIRDFADYDRHQHYTWLNPAKAGICRVASDYAFGSASSKYELDPVPQGLKPFGGERLGGTAEAVPFPNTGIEASLLASDGEETPILHRQTGTFAHPSKTKFEMSGRINATQK